MSASKTAQDKALSMPAMDVRLNTTVQEFRGNGRLKSIVTKNTLTSSGGASHPAAAFIFIGLSPNTQIFKNYLEMDAYGYIQTGHDLLHIKNLSYCSDEWLKRMPYETWKRAAPAFSPQGTYTQAATNQIASATGEGASAAISIRSYMKDM